MGKPTLLTHGVKEYFNQLKQAFIEALILQYFDPKCHIWIETNFSGYAIGVVINQMTSDYLTSDQGQ